MHPDSFPTCETTENAPYPSGDRWDSSAISADAQEQQECLQGAGGSLPSQSHVENMSIHRSLHGQWSLWGCIIILENNCPLQRRRLSKNHRAAQALFIFHISRGKRGKSDHRLILSSFFLGTGARVNIFLLHQRSTLLVLQCKMWLTLEVCFPSIVWASASASFPLLFPNKHWAEIICCSQYLCASIWSWLGFLHPGLHHILVPRICYKGKKWPYFLFQ